uniref:RNA-dependent RNA polymerase n=1 Tax=Gyromitra esculenta partitivirus 1 TaxID=2813171 RepID=A0A894K0B4_9VIRU|nr:RNA-dependent RNA polymerase [Gyromitra esculenta partitivirus 1]
MQNIQELAPDFENAVPIRGNDPSKPNPLSTITNRIIDTALHKFLTHEEATKVITGYRRSPWNEDALKHDISKLNSAEHPVVKDEHYWNAINHVFKLIKPDVPLKPVHFADLRQYPWRLSTNVGAPFNSSKHWQNYVKAKYEYFQKGTPFDNIAHRDLFTEAHKTSQPLEILDTRMTKHNLYTEIFYITREHIHIIKNGGTTSRKGQDLRFWNTAFARQHLVKQDDDDKVRLVFGAPFCLLTAELMFIWTLQVHLLLMQGSKSFMLWNFETILGGWYRLRNFFATYALRHQLVATLDWRGFDKDARHTVIKDIHSCILRPCYDFDHGYHPTKDYPDTTYDEDGTHTGPRIQNLWNWMTDTILSIPLLLPDGTKYVFTHSGIFSGYFQTQILDSLYNMVMIFTILSRMGFDLDKVVIKVQGDDSIFMLLCCFIMICTSFLTLFQHYATYYFGATLSTEKSEVRDSLQHAEVLKYRNNNGIPYRDELSLLAQLRHPERSTDPDAVAARCIGIAYASCGQLPRTYQICEDIFTYLTRKYDATPRQSELNFMFRHLEHIDIKLDASKFPSFYETTRHLVDGPRPLANSHWPKDHFNGLPGR